MHSSSAQGSLAGEVSEASLASQGEVLGHTHLNCPEVGIEVSCSRLRELFGHQRRYMDAFFDGLEFQEVHAFLQMILGCPGCIFFTGVGKSGFIAQKLSQVMVSTGTKAMFLSPTDALHGDIGSVASGDLVIFISKSGATEELLTLLPFIRAKGARIAAMVCGVGSQLGALADATVVLPLERELCPFNLAPVTSTAIQMLFGDTLAVAVMEARGLSRDAYACNHPAGRIGKRLLLRVCDVMLEGGAVPCVTPGTPVIDALPLLSAKGCGAVLVVDGGCLVGTFTDGDLRRVVQAVGGAGLQQDVSHAMSTAPRVTQADAKAADALAEMEVLPKVTFLPVVDGSQLRGLVTLHALVSAGL